MASAVPFATLDSSKAARIVNFFIRKGKLQKAWGASLYAQPVVTGGSGGITWIDRFISRWIFQQGNAVALEDSDGSKTFTPIGLITGGENGARINSDKWRNRIFMVNGFENKFYEDSLLTGQKFLTLGIIPPGNGSRSAQPVLAGTVVDGGHLTDATTYKYVITWFDSQRGIESLPNGAVVGDDGLWSGDAHVTVTTATPKLTAEINITAIKAAGYDVDRVTHFIVYRQLQVDGLTYKRIKNDPGTGFGQGVFPIATSVVDDDAGTTDASLVESVLGAILNIDNSPPPSGQNYSDNGSSANYGARFVKFFRDQLWLFGVQYPGLLSESFIPANGIAYASDVQNPDYWPYEFDIARNNQQKDTGLAVFLNTLIFFKERSTYAIEGTNPNNYVVRPIDVRRGCIAPGSIQETPVGVIALSAEGFILSTGSGASTPISEEIFDEVRNINFAQRDKIISAYDNQEGKYECHVPMLPSANNTQIFVYDTNFKTWSMKKIGMSQAVKYDINSSLSRVGLAGDQLTSKLYNVVDETQTTFNGQTILAHWHSKHFDFGVPDKNKRLCLIQIKGKAYTDFKITVDIIMDFGRDTISIPDILSESTYSKWAASATDEAGMDWDKDNWAGEFVDKKFEIPASGIANNFQIIIRESENAANRGGFQLEEILLSANQLGR
jgi:hypothetical protein